MKRCRSSLRNSSTKLSRTITIPSARHSLFSKCSRWLLLIASKPIAGLFTRQKPKKIGRNWTVFLDFADGRSELWNRAMFSNAVARANSILARCGDTAFYSIIRYRRLLWRRETVSREGELFPAMEPRPVASTIFLCSRRRVDRSVSPTLQEKFLACLPTL